MAQGAWDSGTWDDALWDSLPITGNTGTGSAGNLGIAVDQTLTGASATGAAGTQSPGITIAITGVQATGAVGNESETITLALSGAQATGAAGSVSLAAGVAITGVEATGSPGTVIAYIPPSLLMTPTTVTIKRNDGQKNVQRKRNASKKSSTSTNELLKANQRLPKKLSPRTSKLKLADNKPQQQFNK